MSEELDQPSVAPEAPRTFPNISTAYNKLTTALIKAQKEFKEVVRETVNTYYDGKKYADLATLFKATQPALINNGLVVIQTPISKPGPPQLAGVTTTLFHESGEYLVNELLLPATGLAKGGGLKYDAQTIGSAVTYARRYTYQSILGIAAEDDADGNEISQEDRNEKRTAPKGKTATRSQSEQTATEGITDDQYNDYIKKAKSAGDRLKAAGLTDSNGLNVNQKLKGFILKTTGKANLKQVTVAEWDSTLLLVEKIIEKKELDTIWKEE